MFHGSLPIDILNVVLWCDSCWREVSLKS